MVVQSEGKEELTYKIQVYWSNLEHINPGQEVKFIFSEKEQRQLYHLELEGKEFKELRIVIRPTTRRYPFDKVTMYGKYGSDSNPTST